jgi:hypothetical protein
MCTPAGGVDVRQPALQVVLDDQLDCAFHAPCQELLGDNILESRKGVQLYYTKISDKCGFHM